MCNYHYNGGIGDGPFMFVKRLVTAIPWHLALTFRNLLQVDLFMWLFMPLLSVLVHQTWECAHCVGDEVITVTVFVEW